MKTLLVVNSPKRWPLAIPGVEVVAAHDYLTEERYGVRGLRVFNLCRSYSYQSTGYYVSLLATARGHKPLPSITTILDMRSPSILRFVSEDVEDVIQRSLAPIRSKKFTLSIYFGRNVAKRYDRLSSALFRVFEAPLLRATFEKKKRWLLQNMSPISTSEIPESHRPYLVRFAKEYLEGRRYSARKRIASRFDLAILHNPEESDPPSDPRALRKFVRAAESLNLGVELVRKEDYGRLAEFDALFIRETTNVDHHTYRFARRAMAEGMVVIDDPESILRCTNKVYLAELLRRHRVPTPRTAILHRRDSLERVGEELGFPCILKQPDSAFSQGVVKVEDAQALQAEAGRLLHDSDLVIAQEFLPTEFDWRVGILDRQPLYVCKYFMARSHWQIIERRRGKSHEGKVETLPVEEVPRAVVRIALRAANLIGDGLYGVDVKQVGRKCYVIEINDNPNLEAGYEDQVLKDRLYLEIMNVFLKRIEQRKQEFSSP